LVNSPILIGIVTLATHTRGKKENILKLNCPLGCLGRHSKCFVSFNACREETFIVIVTGNLFDEFARLVNLEELKMFRNKVKNMSIASLKGHLARGH